jgi:SPP1 family predicted phage head-tail adaptor
MPAAGKYRNLVTVQQRSAAKDSFGQQVLTWVDQFQVFASIEPLTARELVVGQAVNAEVSHKVCVLWRTELATPAPAAALRMVHVRPEGTRYLGIVGVLNISEARRQIELLCAEGANQG